VAAIRLAVDAGLDRHAWQLAWSMAPFIPDRSLADAIAVHQVALQAAQRLGDLPGQGYSLRMLGNGHLLLGEFDEARARYEHAREVYRQLGDNRNQAHVHLGLGVISNRQDRHLDALHEVERALTLFRAAGHRVSEATALNNLGCSHRHLGDHETALTYCQQALGLQQELGYRRGEAEAWDSVGLAYQHLGRNAEAVTSYRQALALFQDLGHRYSEADTWVNLGDAHHASGDTGAAQNAWQCALAILADLDHPEAEEVRVKLRSAPAPGTRVRSPGGESLPGPQTAPSGLNVTESTLPIRSEASTSTRPGDGCPGGPAPRGQRHSPPRRRANHTPG
jgi:tetratricopeptide (TPR) repeat protein